jgi:hypothetical protein
MMMAEVLTRFGECGVQLGLRGDSASAHVGQSLSVS